MDWHKIDDWFWHIAMWLIMAAFILRWVWHIIKDDDRE